MRISPKVRSDTAQRMEIFDKVRTAALNFGIRMRFSKIKPVRKKHSFHVMFETASGVRILNYWPSNGTIWSPRLRQKEKVANMWEAMARARELNGVD